MTLVNQSANTGRVASAESERPTDAQRLQLLVVDASRLDREAIADLLRDRPWLGAIEPGA